MTPNEEIEKALADLHDWMENKTPYREAQAHRLLSKHYATFRSLLTAAIKPEAREVGREIQWHERKRRNGSNYFFATPLCYYEIGDDGFMYQPWICKYPDIETAKAEAQKDFDKKLQYVLTGSGSVEDVPLWKDVSAPAKVKG